MEVTYPQILTFRQNARQYIAESGTKNNHLIYALSRMLERTDKHDRKYRRKIEEARIDHALVKDGCFVRDKANQIEIDPVKAKKFHEAMENIQEEPVSIETYLARTVPEDLPTAYYQVFVPFVIEDFPSPEEPQE
jgi:hypothetical protein